MKCTWNKCGKETGKACPPEWVKHQTFDPRVINAFFAGMGVDVDEELERLDAFVCKEHKNDYLAWLHRSQTEVD